MPSLIGRPQAVWESRGLSLRYNPLMERERLRGRWRESGKGVDRNGRRRKQEETFKLCAVKNVFDGTSSAITFYFCSHTRGDKSLKTRKKATQELAHPPQSVCAAARPSEQTRTRARKQTLGRARLCGGRVCVFWQGSENGTVCDNSG